MRHPFVSNQSGSLSLAALAGILTLSLASLYVLQSTRLSAQKLDRSKLDNLRQSAKVSTLNVLSQYKALVNPKAIGGGLYQPALYPLNYFDGYWNLARNGSISTQSVTGIDRGNVQLKTVRSDLDFDAEAQSLLQGNKSLLANLNVQTVKFIRANFDAAKPTLVKTIDVEVTTNAMKDGSIAHDKAMARIPVLVPDAYDPVIEFSPAGANTWTRNPGTLSGLYDIRVLGSGVVTVARVTIGSAGPYELGGFDAQTGSIKHGATNILARNVEIGRVTYNFDSGVAASYDYKVIDPKVSCKAVPVLSDAAVAVDVKISVELLNPADTVSGDIGKTTTTVQTQPAAPPGEPANLAFEDVNKMCEDKCQYIYPTNPLDEGPNYQAQVDGIRLAQMDSKKFTDYAWGYMRHIRGETGVMDAKICENIRAPYDQLSAKLGRPATSADNIFEDWSQLEYVYYKGPGCERKFLFNRNSCGCFQEDTQITLGDGRSTKSIQELTETDLVWNPILQRAQTIKRMTRGPEKLPLLKISSQGASVSVTGGHPFPIQSGPIKRAFDLVVGESIQIDGQWQKIESIETVHSTEQPIVWNLELDGYAGQDGHFVLANGIVTGDLKIQEELAVP